jgi:hypothetical protein
MTVEDFSLPLYKLQIDMQLFIVRYDNQIGDYV